MGNEESQVIEPVQNYIFDVTTFAYKIAYVLRQIDKSGKQCSYHDDINTLYDLLMSLINNNYLYNDLSFNKKSFNVKAYSSCHSTSLLDYMVVINECISPYNVDKYKNNEYKNIIMFFLFEIISLNIKINDEVRCLDTVFNIPFRTEHVTLTLNISIEKYIPAIMDCITRCDYNDILNKYNNIRETNDNETKLHEKISSKKLSFEERDKYNREIKLVIENRKRLQKDLIDNYTCLGALNDNFNNGYNPFYTFRKFNSYNDSKKIKIIEKYAKEMHEHKLKKGTPSKYLISKLSVWRECESC